MTLILTPDLGPEDEPAWFSRLLLKLIASDLALQLPGKPAIDAEGVTEDDARRLIGFASVLSLSPVKRDRSISYEVATRLIELFGSRLSGLVSAADIILSRLGNFPGRELLRSRFSLDVKGTPGLPFRLSLERTAREMENTIENPDLNRSPSTQGLRREQSLTLTDFQYNLYMALDSSDSVSVSAPTSAGKSFILGLDLVRRLRHEEPRCVVYVVPTRALIREVALNLRQSLSRAGLKDVPVRTVPFPIAPDKAPRGSVFVLTQERLLSLIHSRVGSQLITTLVVDEAQGIQDDARGVVLQTAIEAVLVAAPTAEVHFASPLSKNPEFLLELIQRGESGISYVEELSPVSQNLILVSDVPKKPRLAKFQLAGDFGPLDLGQRDLGFEFRGSTYGQRAQFAIAVTRADERTLLFANDPSDTEELAKSLIERLPEPESIGSELLELEEFIRSEVHPEYPLADCLSYGVAYHYGFMPSILRSRVEDLYKSDKLKFVCCTSTLLQGVNLPARHIIIENPKRGQSKPMSRRDFVNLAGRAGRLLKEFHGNVWCLRPATWGEKSFEGERLQEISSAFDAAMSDGGTIVHEVLANRISKDEVDYGEAILGKLYCDFVRGGRDLANAPWRNAENASILEETARLVASLQITLPTEVLDANRAVRPDRLQSLYDVLRASKNLSSLIPLSPFVPDSNNRLGTIIQLVFENLAGYRNKSHIYFKQLAVKWIHQEPLARIISEHVIYKQSESKKESVSAIIRTLLKDLEVGVRFRLVKYFLAYNGVLEIVLRERNLDREADSLEPFHVYLECGAIDRIALNLIALGLSRATALALRRKVSFPLEASPEDCFAQLGTLDLSRLQIPGLCVREVQGLLGLK